MFDFHVLNHPQCLRCWFGRRGTVQPYRIEPSVLTICCWCGAQTDEGIFLRAKASDLAFCLNNPVDRVLFLANL